MLNRKKAGPSLLALNRIEPGQDLGTYRLERCIPPGSPSSEPQDIGDKICVKCEEPLGEWERVLLFEDLRRGHRV